MPRLRRDPNTNVGGTLRFDKSPLPRAGAVELSRAVASSPLLTKLAGVLNRDEAWTDGGKLKRTHVARLMGLNSSKSLDALLVTAGKLLDSHRNDGRSE